MSNQTFILVCIILCSLGGWYVVLTKYLELKLMMQDAEIEQPVAEYTGRHIPGMGLPPPHNIPFAIPPEFLHETNYSESPEPSVGEEITTPKTSKTAAHAKRLVCNWASILHLSGFVLLFGVPFLNILVPTAIWLWKKEEHAFLAKNGREVINFQITYTFIQFLCLCLGALFIYFAPNLAASLFSLTKPWRVVFTTAMHLPFNIFTVIPFVWACIVMLRGTVAAYHGINYKYPVAQEFIFTTKTQPTAE